MRRLCLLVLAAALAACGGQAPLSEVDAADAAVRAASTSAKVVSPGIYRSPRPTLADLQALKAAGVKFILDLEDTTSAINQERAWAAQLGMTFVSEPMSGFWTPNDAQVNRIEAYLADAHHRPILVHCQHGEDRTGLIIGLYRVQHEGWTPAAAYKEMLANGFHQILFLLNHYYEEKTGFED